MSSSVGLRSCWLGMVLLGAVCIGCAGRGCDCSGEGPTGMAGSAAPSPGAGAPADEWEPLVQEALGARDRALETVQREKDLEVSELWVLQKVVEAAGLDTLKGRIAHWKAGVKRDKPKKLALVDPTAPRPQLPDSPGQGIRRLNAFVTAAYAVPESRAYAFLQEFLQEPADGYALTHQLMCIIWWEDSRGSPPPNMERERERLVERVAEEQRADSTFSDLFAERAFILGFFGDACVEDMARWARIIIDAQASDGLWGKMTWTFRYADLEFEASGVLHTAVLSIGALQAFLDAAADPERRCEG
jgi:hypothetical protein